MAGAAMPQPVIDPPQRDFAEAETNEPAYESLHVLGVEARVLPLVDVYGRAGFPWLRLSLRNQGGFSCTSSTEDYREYDV